MNYSKPLLLIPLLALSASAAAEDNISVTINGRSYQCSGQGGGGEHGRYRYSCGCEIWSGEYYGAYYKIDRETGGQERLKWIDDNGTRSKTAPECEAKLSAYAICRR